MDNQRSLSLYRSVLDTIRARGAMSNAEVREVLRLDADAVMRVGTALRDGVRHGHLVKIPADALTKQRYEMARDAAAVGTARSAGDVTPRMLRADAIRLLTQAGDHTMPCAAHERLLSLIARAELISTAAGQGRRVGALGVLQ